MTRRSRSSFDLSDALATAEALSPKPPSVEPPAKEFAGVPLVHFGQMHSRPPMAPEGPRPPAPVAPPPPSAPKSELGAAPNVGVLGGLLPKLGALLDWVRADGSVTRAIVVDDEGLPMVGMGASDLSETEGLFAATGSVASAMGPRALATPGAP